MQAHGRWGDEADADLLPHRLEVRSDGPSIAEAIEDLDIADDYVASQLEDVTAARHDRKRAGFVARRGMVAVDDLAWEQTSLEINCGAMCVECMW